MSFEGVSDPSLHPLVVSPHIEALKGDMGVDDTLFSLAPFRDIYKSEKLVIDSSCTNKHEIIIYLEDIFVEKYLSERLL